MKKTIENSIEDVLSGFPDIFVVEQVLSDCNKRIVLTIDSDKGLTIRECQVITKRIRKYLFEEEIINYSIEVTSPGIDKPLKNNRQYVKNIGRELEITLADDTCVTGVLKKVNESEIELSITDNKINKTTIEIIKFSDIHKSSLVTEF